jgi:hypothetical protein
VDYSEFIRSAFSILTLNDAQELFEEMRQTVLGKNISMRTKREWNEIFPANPPE